MTTYMALVTIRESIQNSQEFTSVWGDIRVDDVFPHHSHVLKTTLDLLYLVTLQTLDVIRGQLWTHALQLPPVKA